MNSSEKAPSNEWTALEHMWDGIAEAWYKPERQGSTLMFRIPQHQFQMADASQRITIENLLKDASVSNDDVESWHLENDGNSGVDSSRPDLRSPLAPPPPNATHLTVLVHLRPPAPTASTNEIGEQQVLPQTWHALEARWKTILGLEVSIDTLRLNMDGIRSEMEGAFKKALGVEEKVHALQADVLQWNKAKSRVHYALPKVREFVHRATWATGVHERKRVEELVTKHIEPRIPHPDMDQVRDRLDHLQKDRQVLFGQGNSVFQECRVILAEIERALNALKRNAANVARNKRSAGREKGKHI